MRRSTNAQPAQPVARHEYTDLDGLLPNLEALPFSAKVRLVFVGERHEYTDLDARLAFRRRVNELQDLAASEGIALPYPATWIATQEAQQLRRDGAL